MERCAPELQGIIKQVQTFSEFKMKLKRHFKEKRLRYMLALYFN